MKNNVNRKNINVDKQNIIPLWNFKQEDDAILKLALYKGAIPFDITGQTIVLGAKRPNNTVVEQTDGFTINGNEIDIALKNNILAANGLVELDLQITDVNGKLTTASFFITVAKKVLGENNLNASNDISAINQLVADLQAKTEEVNNAISTIEPKADQLMNDIQTDYNTLRKTIMDENQAANLQGQITDLGSQLDTNKKKIDNILTPELFGAVGDGVTDDTEAIQTMFNNAKCGQQIKFKANTKYKITNTIDIPRFLEVDGCNCFIMLYTEMIGKFAFNYGVETNNHIIDTFSMQNEIKNFNIQHYAEVEGQYYNGIYVNYDCVIKNIYTWGLNRTIQVDTNYIDMVIIDGVNVWGQWGEDYIIDTGFTGDCREVKNVHVHHTSKSGKTIKVGDGHNTCRIKGIINGGIEVGSSMVELSDLHLEHGQIIIKSKANVKISNLFYFMQNTYEGISIGDNTNVTLENCQFNYCRDIEYSTSYYHPILLNSKVTTNLIIRNCFKNMMPNNDIGFRATSGITIKDFYEFNENSLNNSVYSIIRHGDLITQITPKTRTDNSYSYLGSVYKDGNFTWYNPTGTYFYKAILIFDEKRKLAEIGQSNEISTNVEYNKSCPYIVLNGGMNSNIKLYKGTTSGQYDNVVTVGANYSNILDNGVLVNGDKWKSRNIGAIDTYNECSNYIKNQDGTVTVMMNAIPTVGTWVKGDRIINGWLRTGGIKSWIYSGAEWLSEGTF